MQFPVNSSIEVIYKISCSVTMSCTTLCHPVDCSTQGFPVLHRLPEFTQDHVHRFGDAIQPSHPLLHSSFGFRLSKHQGLGFPGGSDRKESACHTGDLGSIPGLGKSPVKGNGNPLCYSCLENSKDRGAWQTIVHRVTNSRT